MVRFINSLKVKWNIFCSIYHSAFKNGLGIKLVQLGPYPKFLYSVAFSVHYIFSGRFSELSNYPLFIFLENQVTLEANFIKVQDGNLY